MTLTIILWVLGIHLLELTIFGFYLLIRKNNTLEQIVVSQQTWIDAISIRIADSREKLSELDQAGIFQADDEVGYFFKNLIEIQRDLDQFVK